MTAIPHEPSNLHRDAPTTWWAQLIVPQMWATLAIVVIWLAVLFASIYAADTQTWSVSGDHATIPSAVLITPFAFLATWVVARNGYRRDKAD
jgi:ABC-type antimicrobial peptide transport system permease subunit